MNIQRVFGKALVDLEERGWSHLYVVLDLHGTVIEPTWRKDGAIKFYPDTLEALKMLSDDKRFNLIVWTSAYANDIQKVVDELEKHGIRIDQINGNSLEKSTELQDFSRKFYFNIGIDDRFGFEPETDWRKVIDFLKAHPENNLKK